MFKALLKTRFAYIFAMMFRSKKDGSKSKGPIKKILIGLLALYIVGVFAFMFGAMFMMLAEPFHQAGIDWFYFTLIIILSVVLCFIGSVFFTKSEIYDSKDNDLLLSMPIPPRMILASRLVSLLLISYAYELLIFVPAGVVYAYKIGFSIQQVIILVLIALILPLVSLTLSLIFSGIIAFFESKMRRKNVFTLVLSLVLFMGYMYFYIDMNRYLTELVANGAEWATSIKNAVYILYCGGNAIARPSIIDFIFFACFAIIPFILACMVLSVTFTKISTTKKSAAKIEYKEERVKKSTVISALIRRENNRFWSLPMYVLNAALGALFLIILAIALPIKGKDIVDPILASVPSIGDYVGIIVCAIIGFIVIMNIISAPSISIEGKTFWVLRSLPVKSSDILLSKVYFHLYITAIPTLLASVSACIFLPSSALDKAMIILLPQALNTFNAFLGITINLQFPKFNWVNETAAVKQSASSGFTMLGGMGIVGTLAAVYALLLNKFLKPDLFMFIIFAITVFFTFILYKYLMGKGAQKFDRL